LNGWFEEWRGYAFDEPLFPIHDSIRDAQRPL